jgi:hypothetical protein
MNYEGRVQLGDGDDAIKVVVMIPDVEYPEWFAVVERVPSLPRGEVTVTLLDGDIYNAWRGSALVNDSDDGTVRLLGLMPLTPPVGA